MTIPNIVKDKLFRDNIIYLKSILHKLDLRYKSALSEFNNARAAAYTQVNSYGGRKKTVRKTGKEGEKATEYESSSKRKLSGLETWAALLLYQKLLVPASKSYPCFVLDFSWVKLSKEYESAVLIKLDNFYSSGAETSIKSHGFYRTLVKGKFIGVDKTLEHHGKKRINILYFPDLKGGRTTHGLFLVDLQAAFRAITV